MSLPSFHESNNMVKNQAEIVEVVRNKPNMCLTQLLTAVGMNVVGSNYRRLRNIVESIPSLELYQDGKAVKVRLKPFNPKEATYPIKELKSSLLKYLDTVAALPDSFSVDYDSVRKLHTEAINLLQDTIALDWHVNLVINDLAESQDRFNRVLYKLRADNRECISL